MNAYANMINRGFFLWVSMFRIYPIHGWSMQHLCQIIHSLVQQRLNHIQLFHSTGLRHFARAPTSAGAGCTSNMCVCVYVSYFTVKIFHLRMSVCAQLLIYFLKNSSWMTDALSYLTADTNIFNFQFHEVFFGGSAT